MESTTSSVPTLAGIDTEFARIKMKYEEEAKKDSSTAHARTKFDIREFSLCLLFSKTLEHASQIPRASFRLNFKTPYRPLRS